MKKNKDIPTFNHIKVEECLTAPDCEHIFHKPIKVIESQEYITDEIVENFQPPVYTTLVKESPEDKKRRAAERRKSIRDLKALIKKDDCDFYREMLAIYERKRSSAQIMDEYVQKKFGQNWREVIKKNAPDYIDSLE